VLRAARAVWRASAGNGSAAKRQRRAVRPTRGHPGEYPRAATAVARSQGWRTTNDVCQARSGLKHRLRVVLGLATGCIGANRRCAGKGSSKDSNLLEVTGNILRCVGDCRWQQRLRRLSEGGFRLGAWRKSRRKDLFCWTQRRRARLRTGKFEFRAGPRGPGWSHPACRSQHLGET
jgi:hypothetical protein